MIRMLSKTVLPAVVLIALMAPIARADSPTGNLTVTATVSNVCYVPGNTLPFGAYDPVVTNQTTNLDQQANIDVFCTAGTDATAITLDNGVNSSGAVRRMLNAADASHLLTYELYLDSARTTVWSSGTGQTVDPDVSTSSTVKLTTTVSGSQGPIVVYGRVFSGSNTASNKLVYAGSFSDTVVETVNF